jgi:HSP20 family protein
MRVRDMLPSSRNKGEMVKRRDESLNHFYSLQRDMNRIFDRFFEDFQLPPFEDKWASTFPSVDVKESDREIRVSAELPGLDEKDIDITISGNLLTIRGEKKQEKEDKTENYYRKERSYGSFYRDIPLPTEVESEKVDASYKNGVLGITVPKKPEGKRKKIAIKSV